VVSQKDFLFKTERSSGQYAANSHFQDRELGGLAPAGHVFEVLGNVSEYGI
jgi:hypothetical protein